MAVRRSENRSGNGRRDFARFLLMVLPGFMFVGLLAPAAVSVKPIADQGNENEERVEPASYRRFEPIRPPQAAQSLKISREVASTAQPDSGAVEPLFSGARLAAGGEREIPLPPVAAQAQQGGEIMLAQEDAVEDYVSDSMFDESIDAPVLTVDLTPLWDPAIFDRIPATISKGGFTQYDDFHGNGMRLLVGTPPVPIPEPRTGAILALGLIALALHARQSN